MTTSLAQFQATTRQLWQAWQAKTITSDLIFEMVMQNPTLCTELVQRALPELEVGPLHLVNPQQDVHSASWPGRSATTSTPKTKRGGPLS
ncbi:hypothetical protein [Limosilactobacillus ingluviei]|uniref:hypothetical protein n=1 Tax=Limosilactobacillus ingluviei TaxID=148604 RepID=UPI0002E40896|nr:hypothetical protein [Limosilactobacillus ingluviei]